MERNANLIIPLVKREIMDLVGDDEIAKAAIFLLQLVQAYDPNKEDEVLVLKGSISAFEKQQRLGTLNAEADVKRNKLAHQLLMILKTIRQAKGWED